jgi:glycosyltransferase involved in cell wall biosynthesis
MIILKDTSLCAIVRDEKMNPAGGIKRFVESHVPYVEEAIIADTGSVDGTREILEEMQAKYSNLRIFDIPFNGYADARNQSLKHVKTKLALVLDADELICHEKPQNDWEVLNESITINSADKYRMLFEQVFPDRVIRSNTLTHTLRLFDAHAGFSFQNYLWESLQTDSTQARWVDIYVRHFLPSNKAAIEKWANWYLENPNGEIEIDNSKREEHWKKPPSTVEGFKHWKKYNPLRDNYN